MNTPTDNLAVMPLEEVRERLDALAAFFGTTDWSDRDLCLAALHHLEAGKRDRRRLDFLQDRPWVDIRNHPEDWTSDDGRGPRSLVDASGGMSGEGKSLREAIDESFETQPQPKGES